MQKLILSACIVAILLFSRAAEAYIDPGSGSYILQMLTAGFFAALFALRLFWSRIRSYFKRMPAEGRDDGGDQHS